MATSCSVRVRVDLRRVVLFFLPQVLLVLLLVLLSIRIYLRLHLVEVVRYENASTLAPCLRFSDVEHRRGLVCLLLG